jgi:hypothetical protein
MFKELSDEDRQRRYTFWLARILDPIPLFTSQGQQEQPHAYILMLCTQNVDASGILNNVCCGRQWITIELWEEIKLVYRELVWISVNSFKIQGLVCFMKAPQSHVSIT